MRRRGGIRSSSHRACARVRKIPPAGHVDAVVDNVWGLTRRRHVDLRRLASSACPA
ncbi:putative leader peptide [Agilicoccus flavus]|uniref:putative leader peptide n=1 Tax=Agilicoccus flavus TaxID=2775968 RepID=UPI00355794DB